MKSPWEIKERLRALENTLNAKQSRFDETTDKVEWAELLVQIRLLKWVLGE